MSKFYEKYMNKVLQMEAIDPKDWKDKKHLYRKGTMATFTKNGGLASWKEMYPQMKKIMKGINNGKFARTVVIEPTGTVKKKKLAGNRDFILFLSTMGWSASEQSIEANTIKTKEGKEIALTDFLKMWDNKLKNINKVNQKMDELEDKEKIGKLSVTEKKILTEKQKEYKQLTEYQKMRSKFEDSHILKGKKIVISIVPRLIASQSTQVAWDSCMQFDRKGGVIYADKAEHGGVGGGIANGVLIAFLVEYGDTDIAKPISRCLIKPFKNSKGDIFWYADKVYTTKQSILVSEKGMTEKDAEEMQKFADRSAGKFRGVIYDILEPFNADIPEDDYKLSSGIYNDTKGEYKVTPVTKYIMKGDFSDLKGKDSKFLTELANQEPNIWNKREFQEAIFSHDVIDGDINLSNNQDIKVFGEPWS